MLSQVNLTSAQFDNKGHRRCGNVRECAHWSIYFSLVEERRKSEAKDGAWEQSGGEFFRDLKMFLRKIYCMTRPKKQLLFCNFFVLLLSLISDILTCSKGKAHFWP